MEGTAEWSATGPENRGIVMSDGRSIRLPSAKLAQVREPGRNGPAVTRSPRVGRGGSNPPLCTKCQRVRIGIAAYLRNRYLRVRMSPLAANLSCVAWFYGGTVTVAQIKRRTFDNAARGF